jgi:hypothetical protein
MPRPLRSALCQNSELGYRIIAKPNSTRTMGEAVTNLSNDPCTCDTHFLPGRICLTKKVGRIEAQLICRCCEEAVRRGGVAVANFRFGPKSLTHDANHMRRDATGRLGFEQVKATKAKLADKDCIFVLSPARKNPRRFSICSSQTEQG